MSFYSLKDLTENLEAPEVFNTPLELHDGSSLWAILSEQWVNFVAASLAQEHFSAPLQSPTRESAAVIVVLHKQNVFQQSSINKPARLPCLQDTHACKTITSMKLPLGELLMKFADLEYVISKFRLCISFCNKQQMLLFILRGCEIR